MESTSREGQRGVNLLPFSDRLFQLQEFVLEFTNEVCQAVRSQGMTK
ncbi:unnamed protein product [Gulo gulo]|uniref:Uncharacterized protein n=1 Tax=Gulo gulo TaxID=48420 RepID=A0A9X9LFZ1_GULGU|nr:unnamed protein product [Gulo gulo]